MSLIIYTYQLQLRFFKREGNIIPAAYTEYRLQPREDIGFVPICLDEYCRVLISEDPIAFEGGDYNLFRMVRNNPVNFVDPIGLYWFRQDWQTPGVIGRPVTPVPPGGTVSEFIEKYVPAGYTFGEMHDAFVDAVTGVGLPDWLVNIPSMSPMFMAAQVVEVLRNIRILDQATPPTKPTPCK